MSSCGVGGAGPLPGDPNNNVVLSAVGAYGGIDVTWTYPSVNPHAVAYVKVFRGATSSPGSADMIGEVGGSRYFDKLATVSTFYYWIQLISINGTVLALVGPDSATSLLGITETIANLTGLIDSSLLATALRTQVDQVPLLATDLADEIFNRGADHDSVLTLLGEVQTDVDGANAAIVTETGIRIAQNSATAIALDLVAVTSANDLAAAILTESIARADEDTALGIRIDNIVVDGSGVTAAVNDLAATKIGYSALDNGSSTPYDGDGSTIVYPSGTYPTVDFPAYSVNRARIIDKLGVTNWNALGVGATTPLVWIAGMPLATAVKQVQVTGPDGASAVLQTAMTAQSTLNTGFKAQYTVKLDVAGYVSGFGLYNDGVGSAALFNVDTFAIGKVGATNLYPFIVTGGVVYIKEAVIPILTAGKIDTRGLVIRNAGNQVIFGAGAEVDPTTYLQVPAGWLNSNLTASITAAQTAGDNAGIAAGTANTALAAIASDSILSPSEKPSVKLDYDIIIAEQTGIQTQATSYSVSQTAYNAAVSALTAHLDTLTGWNDIPGGNVTIVGATFRTKFGDVYVARQALLNAIAAAAKVLANNAQTTADNADTAADAAQTDADIANGKLADIASDSMLTASEKQATKLEWDSIQAEKTGINTQATATGFATPCATENGTYNTSYTTLSSYITDNSLLVSLTTSTAIVGATFRTNFANYYTARQALLNKIAATAATLATWATVSGAPTTLAALNTNDGLKLTGIATGATKNLITSSASAPGSPVDGDIWVDTNAPVTIKTRIGGIWVSSGSIVTNLTQVNSTEGGKLTGIADNATKNVVSSGTFAAIPAGLHGDFYYGTDTFILYQKINAAWVPTSTLGAPAGTFVNGVAVATLTTAVTNFNAANDRTATAVVAPTILANDTAIDHTIGTDGSADISFEWQWAGTEGDIDGFEVYVYQSTSATAYTFGTDSAGETVIAVPAFKRAFVLFGVVANKRYTFGVRAYRKVDKDISASGVVASSVVKPSATLENPYQPTSTVAFNGDVLGTIASTSAALVVSNSTTAMQGITDLASDSLLTPSEKQQLKLELDSLALEKPLINTQAGARGVSTTTFDAAYTALTTNYANALVADLTVNSVIVGTTLRSNFATYYQARQTILNSIASAAAATAVWTSVSSKPTTLAELSAADGTLLSGIDTGTAKYRLTGVPTNAPGISTATQVATADGNIVVTIPFTYTQGTPRQADLLIMYVRDGGGVVATTDVAFAMPVNAAGNMTLTLKPSTTYRFGIQAGRRTEAGLEVTAITQGTDIVLNAGNYTGNVAGTLASTVVSNASSALSGLTTKLNNAAASTLSGTISVDATAASGIRVGSITWNAGGSWVGGFGVAVTPFGIIGTNNAGTVTFSLSASTGNLIVKGDITGSTGTFGGTLLVGSSPAISGTTMSGSGGVINANGSFAIGTAARNITYNGSDAPRLNGDWVAENNIAYSSFSVALSATSISYSDTAPFTVSSGAVTTTVTGGIGTKTYEWTLTIYDMPTGCRLDMDNGVGLSYMNFSAHIAAAGNAITAEAVCRVTDANGRSCTANVYFTVQSNA